MGVVINAFTAFMFMSGRKSDLNIRGAYLHMAADAAISAGQSSGRFNAFKQQTANQRADALKAIECGRGLYRDAECAAAARKTQEIALSLQSVAGALQALKP